MCVLGGGVAASHNVEHSRVFNLSHISLSYGPFQTLLLCGNANGLPGCNRGCGTGETRWRPVAAAKEELSD